MNIFIHTYGRHDTQVSLNGLPASIQERVWLVVQDREKHLYGWYPRVLVLPKNIQSLSPTRQYIMEYAHKNHMRHVCMMDDDLRFYQRRKDETDKFLPATAKQLEAMFDKLDKVLDTHAHAGILAREGGNRITSEYKYCTRMMRILAYDSFVFHKEKIRFDRVPLQQDFDVTLQLLKKGYKNIVLCKWVQNQGGSNTKGGCSTYRTLDTLNANVKKLMELHSPFVKSVTKKTKTAWGGAERLDVQVQWKKAYESSKNAD